MYNSDSILRSLVQSLLAFFLFLWFWATFNILFILHWLAWLESSSSSSFLSLFVSSSSSYVFAILVKWEKIEKKPAFRFFCSLFLANDAYFKYNNRETNRSRTNLSLESYHCFFIPREQSKKISILNARNFHCKSQSHLSDACVLSRESATAVFSFAFASFIYAILWLWTDGLWFIH